MHAENRSRSLPQPYYRPGPCLDMLQPVCSLASKAQILIWPNLAKIKHFTLSLKVTQPSLFPTMHCYIRIYTALRRTDANKMPEIHHENARMKTLSSSICCLSEYQPGAGGVQTSNHSRCQQTWPGGSGYSLCIRVLPGTGKAIYLISKKAWKEPSSTLL